MQVWTKKGIGLANRHERNGPCGACQRPVCVPCMPRANEDSRRSGPDAREMTEGGRCAGALGARVGGQVDELGAVFPQAPCQVVVLGLVAGDDYLFVFDVLPGKGGRLVG